MNTMDMYVHFHHIQTGHGFDRMLHILLNGGRYFRDSISELDLNRNIHRSLTLTYLDLDAFGQILATKELRNITNKTAAHASYAIHFNGCQTCNDLDDFGSDLNTA